MQLQVRASLPKAPELVAHVLLMCVANEIRVSGFVDIDVIILLCDFGHPCGTARQKAEGAGWYNVAWY